MLNPGKYDEADALALFLDDQLGAIRNAAYGLTDEQAHQTPTASVFSVGAVLKHAVYVMDGFASRREPGAFDPAAADFGELAKKFSDSFVFGPQETLEERFADFDRARTAFLAQVRALDPAADTVEPPAPWDNRPEPTPITWRYALLHLVEEFARHAGHADIVREQVDGADAMSLDFAANDRPSNPYVQAWTKE